MVMKYPNATAAAKARPKARPGSPRPIPQRPLHITPRKIPGVTLPKPPVPPKVGLKLGAKSIARLVPGLGTLLLAGDVYELVSANVWRLGNWRLTRHCDGGGYPPWRRNNHGVNFTCGYSYKTDAAYNLDELINTSVRNITIYHRGPYWAGGYHHYIIGNSYTRDSGLAPEPAPKIVTAPILVPVEVPNLIPGSVPLSPVTGTPRPKPWGEALPGVGEQPSGAPEADAPPQSRPTWEIPVLPFPVVIFPGVPGMPPEILPPPAPNVQEVVVPAPSPGAGDRPRVSSRPATRHETKNRPPRNREKEKKIHVRTVAGGAWAVLNLITEGLDFLDVLWGALPKQHKTKGRPTPYDKARDIYDNWEAIDVAKAVENYINNQIEDYVYGMIGQQVAKAQGIIGSPTGLSRALSKNQQQFAEQMELELELPEVHYDPTTGEIYLTGFGLSSR